jgi:glucose/arabinose dehydrogenase
LIVITIVLSACIGSSEDLPGDPGPSRAPTQEPSATSGQPAAGAITSERIVEGLVQPVAFTFDRDGRIWTGEKATGRIMVVDPPAQPRLFFTVSSIAAEAEQGLIGIALAPAYPDDPFVYAYATRTVSGSLVDQLLRIEDAGGHGRHPDVLFSSPASELHQHSGGRLLFGPEGDLYLVVGDGLHAEDAQDPSSERGKILRFDLGPSAEPTLWASGIRNSFGLAFDPVSGALWETENGPQCNDELNLVPEDANLGWGPSGTCDSGSAPDNTNADGSHPFLPQLWFSSTIAPTGLAFCDDCHLGTVSEGALFFGAYKGGLLTRVRLSDDRATVVGQRVVAEPSAMVLSIERAPDGYLYYSTYTGIFRLHLAAA